MTDSKITIFLTGATGYLGGSVLQRLLDHPNRRNFEISALVRNADKAKRLDAEFGVKTVVGSLEDLDKLSALSENAHVVIHTADCDHLDAIKAILSGMKARHEKTGDLPLLIHTSGTAELGDDAQGAYLSEKVWSDLNIADIEALPPTALHRPVDLTIVAADLEGYVRTHIILPAMVYGIATGSLFDAGISNPHTIAIPLYVRSALKDGKVAILNKGASAWGMVHINDMTDLYIRMFDTLLSSPEKVSHGREGYFFGENGELTIAEALKPIAEALYALGRVSTPEPVEYSLPDIAKHYGSEFLARVIYANSWCRSERARKELAWTPKHPAKDFVEGVKSEVAILVRKEDEENKA